jgi:hypothetical protein
MLPRAATAAPDIAEFWKNGELRYEESRRISLKDVSW